MWRGPLGCGLRQACSCIPGKLSQGYFSPRKSPFLTVNSARAKDALPEKRILTGKWPVNTDWRMSSHVGFRFAQPNLRGSPEFNAGANRIRGRQARLALQRRFLI